MQGKFVFIRFRLLRKDRVKTCDVLEKIHNLTVTQLIQPPLTGYIAEGWKEKLSEERGFGSCK